MGVKLTPCSASKADKRLSQARTFGAPQVLVAPQGQQAASMRLHAPHVSQGLARPA